MNDLGLTAIFSGHQDVSNLTFLTKTGRATQNPKFEMDAVYNLFRPVNYDNLQLNKAFTYKPGIDFIALNTSAAYMSKGGSTLKYDVFLQLV